MKYWVYMNGEVPGSYTPGELAALPGFTNTTLVCPSEGEILEKNWRRSGEFDELIRAMAERDAKMPPADRRADPAAASADVDSLLDQTSARLFSHVSSLMKELDSRREEKALTASLQRELVELSEQQRAARARVSELELKLTRVNELEETARRDALRIESLEQSLKAREDALGELRVSGEKTRMELDNAKRRLSEALNDLAIRNRLVDKLSRDLTEKELSLAKSLGVIRRLEEDLNRLCPQPEPATQGAAAQEAAAAEAPADQAVPLAPEPAAADAPAEPALASAAPPAQPARPVDPLTASVMDKDPESPAAHSALIDKFKKLISKYDH